MKLYHNSRSIACRNPVGPLKSGMDVTLRILGCSEAACRMRLFRILTKCRKSSIYEKI